VTVEYFLSFHDDTRHTFDGFFVYEERKMLIEMLKVDIDIIVESDVYEGLTKLAPSTTNSAGIDLRAVESGIVYPGGTVKVSAGIKLHVKNTMLPIMAVLAPRSGLGTNENIVLANTVGIVDQDYQGPVIMSIHKRYTPTDTRPFAWNAGDRLAQMIFVPVLTTLVNFNRVSSFSENTERGERGFGGSGVR
jgi:dUTP pyrophosphatase